MATRPSPPPALAPEAELLLLSAAARPNAAAIQRLVAAGVDWELLDGLAHQLSAAPAVLAVLASLRPPLEGDDLAGLRRLATVSVMRQLQLERLLNQTLDGLAERGVEVMLLKGAGLAYTAYPSFADRPMSDLDLLIRPRERTEEAWSFLQTRGWSWPKDRWELAQYTTMHHLPPLTQQPPAGGQGVEFRLELHRELLPGGHPFQLPTDSIWASARRVKRGGRSFTVPSPRHQLWHLCVHFAWQHELRWGAWRAFRDAGMILSGGEFDWDGFLALARDSRAATCCYWTLRLARRLTGAAVPDTALEALHPPRPEFVLGRLERHYTANVFPSKEDCPLMLAKWLWEGGILPRWSGHGNARPWQVSERWAAGAQNAPAPRERPLWAQVARIGAWWRYLRRIQRLTLPSRAES